MQARKNVLEYQPDPNKFDLVVDRWDSQGHRVGARNTYRTFILSGNVYHERPVGSGNLWLENNQPSGRVLAEYNEKGHIVSKTFDFNAKHIEWTPPPTGAQKVAMELESARAELEAAKAELAAIRGERATPIKPEVPKLSRRE